MLTKPTFTTILVKDQEEAKTFYTEKLGFIVWMDEPFGPELRWLVVAPAKENECMLTLVEADTPAKKAAVGNQAPDHVLVVFETEDIDSAYQELKGRGVSFHGEPREVPWGKEVVFEDLYGNLFDLVEPPLAG